MNSIARDKINKDKKKISFKTKFKKTLPSYIILLIMLGLSFLIYEYMQSKVNSDKKALFDKAAVSIISRFKNKEQTNREILNSMYRIHRERFVVRDVFELYGSLPTSTYKSVICMSYVAKVKNADLGTYIFDTRSQGYYDLKIHPEGIRPLYYIVQYFVPVEKNAHRSGYDIKTDPIFEKAATSAFLEDKFTTTHFYNIRPDTLGFYYLAPTYEKDFPINSVEERKKHFTGIIALEIKADDFFKEAIGKGIPSDKTIYFKIRDVDDKGHTKVIYKSDNLKKLAGFVPDMEQTMPLRIGSRTIHFDFYIGPHFIDPMQENLPIIALLIAIALSFVFFAFISSMMISRIRAMEIAEKMTSRQRRIMETTKDMIGVIDLTGKWNSVNPAFGDILKIPSEDIIGKNIQEFFLTTDEEDDFKAFLTKRNKHQEETIRTDIRMKTTSGEILWVNWNFTISPMDDEIYCIGRDVTAERLAEELEEIKTKEMIIAEQKIREYSESKSLFLKEFSYKLRTSLTSIFGYLNLISNKVYETEEELNSYANLAVESSEELYSYLSDINDKIQGEHSSIELAPIKFLQSVNEAKAEFHSESPNVNIAATGIQNLNIIADKELLKTSIHDIFDVLSVKQENTEIQIGVEENQFEGVAEIQVLGKENLILQGLIEIFNNNKGNIEKVLIHDKNDTLLKLEILASNLRRMKGFMKIETLHQEGNVIMITLPLSSTIKTKSSVQMA